MNPSPKIQLLSFAGCPNVEGTREAIKKALKSLALGEVNIEDIDVEAPETPDIYKNYPSPTILIGGKDIEGHEPSDAAACRIYDGIGGVPEVEKILEAIKKSVK
ncbi:MAG: hypothetical protein V3R64_05255 [Sphingomonadales bacterium]